MTTPTTNQAQLNLVHSPDFMRGSPEYGVKCPKCRGQVVMVNPKIIECVNPFCDVGVIP